MLYIIYHKTDLLDYIFESISNKTGIKLIDLNAECSIIQHAFRKFLIFNISLPSLYLGKSLRRILKSLSEDDSLLLIGYTDKNLISSFSKLITFSTRKYLWIWDPLKSKDRRQKFNLFNYIKGQKFEVCTFNPNDSIKYNITLLNQFYRMQQPPCVNSTIKYDFYFLGYLKDRFLDIDILMNKLMKYNTLFHIVTKGDQCISYLENIENIKKTRCIIDLVQKDQEGITLRPLEAIAFGKKLITNNIKIRNQEIYNQKNIFIIGIDDFDKLDKFISSDFQSIDNDIIASFDVNTWIKYFI